MSATLLNTSVSKQTLIRRTGSLSFAGAQTVEALGRQTARYGLVLALIWIGGMKFTAYEAEGISGFVSNSPLMSWAYSLFSIQSFSALLGVTEIAIALLIASLCTTRKSSPDVSNWATIHRIGANAINRCQTKNANDGNELEHPIHVPNRLTTIC